MSVYRKDNSGNIVKIGGYLERRILPSYFITERSLDSTGQEIYTVPDAAKDYFKSIGANTIYYFGFMTANTTTLPMLKFGDQLFSIRSSKTGEPPAIGELKGVYQLYVIPDQLEYIFVISL